MGVMSEQTTKRQVNADEVMRLIEQLEEINSVPLADIEWVNDKGEVLTFDDKTLERWRFVGMSNRSFVEFVVFGDFESDPSDGFDWE